MKKMLALAVILLAGCASTPTPDDFPPPPPMTVIVELPPVTATATLAPNMRPILPEDMQEAQTFFLILKMSMAAGDDVRIAESVRYPIRVSMNGQETLIADPDQFLEMYDRIFDEEFINTLSGIEETDLSLTTSGVQVGNGELWFHYFCADPGCSDSQFLITQINK